MEVCVLNEPRRERNLVSDCPFQGGRHDDVSGGESVTDQIVCFPQCGICNLDLCLKAFDGCSDGRGGFTLSCSKGTMFTQNVERVCVKFHLDKCTPLVVPCALDRVSRRDQA